MAKKTKVALDEALTALIKPQSDKEVLVVLDFDNSISNDPLVNTCFNTWNKEEFEIHVLEEDDVKHLFDKKTKYKTAVEKEDFIYEILKEAEVPFRKKSTYIENDGTEVEIPLKQFKFRPLQHRSCTVNYIISEKNEDFAFIKEFTTTKNLPQFFVITDVKAEEDISGLILVPHLKSLTEDKLIDIIKQEIIYINREEIDKIRWYNIRQDDFINDGLVCHIGE